MHDFSILAEIWVQNEGFNEELFCTFMSAVFGCGCVCSDVCMDASFVCMDTCTPSMLQTSQGRPCRALRQGALCCLSPLGGSRRGLSQVDADSDGSLTWDEYLSYLLREITQTYALLLAQVPPSHLIRVIRVIRVMRLI